MLTKSHTLRSVAVERTLTADARHLFVQLVEMHLAFLGGTRFCDNVTLYRPLCPRSRNFWNRFCLTIFPMFLTGQPSHWACQPYHRHVTYCADTGVLCVNSVHSGSLLHSVLVAPNTITARFLVRV